MENLNETFFIRIRTSKWSEMSDIIAWLVIESELLLAYTCLVMPSLQLLAFGTVL